MRSSMQSLEVPAIFSVGFCMQYTIIIDSCHSKLFVYVGRVEWEKLMWGERSVAGGD